MESTSKNWYDRYYKWFFVIQLAFVLMSIIYLYNFNAKNGDIIYKDVSLTGGTTITLLDANININYLRAHFPGVSVKSLSDVSTGKQLGVLIETKESAEIFTPKLEEYIGYKLTSDNSSVEFSGASISEGFYKQLRVAIFIAFILMAATVFVIFRSPIPSIAIIFAAFSDIIFSIVVINLFGIEVSVAGIVAFLMLIGYSVDTDILLTTRVLKTSEGTVNHRIFGAFKTGMTMTLAAIAAIAASLWAVYSLSDTLRQIFGIILIGLGFDIYNTWGGNATIVKWFVERRK